jgi:FixJ family two-component response regulator
MVSAHPVIAIVDDDAGVRRALRRLLISLDCQPTAFASGEAFLDSLGAEPPQCVLMDLHLPGLKGIDVLDRLRTGGVRLPVIIITGLDQPGMRERCMAAGAASYLTKPLDRSALGSAIEHATAVSPPAAQPQ